MEVRVRKQITDAGNPRYRYEDKSNRKNINFKQLEAAEALSFHFTPSMGKSDRKKVRELWKHKLPGQSAELLVPIPVTSSEVVYGD